MDKLKCYSVYPSKDSYEYGCLLVFAKNRNTAKTFACGYGFWSLDYIDYNAVRIKRLDYIAEGKTETFAIETNEELPNGETFYDDDII